MWIAAFCSSLVELEKPVCPSRPVLGRQARRCCTRVPLAEDTGAPEHHDDDDDDQAGGDFHLHEEEFVEEHPEVRTRLPQFVNKRCSIISRTDRPRIDEQVGQAVKKVGCEHFLELRLQLNRHLAGDGGDATSSSNVVSRRTPPPAVITCNWM